MTELDPIVKLLVDPQPPEVNVEQEIRSLIAAKQSVDPQFVDLPPEDPIQMVKDGRTEEFKQYLSLHPETLDQLDPSPRGKTFMHYAAHNNRAEIVEYLIFLGSKAQGIYDRMGNLPIYYASGSARLATLDVLIRFETDLNSPSLVDSDITTPLKTAFSGLKFYENPIGFPEYIRTLIFGGAILDLSDQMFLILHPAKRYAEYELTVEDRARIQNRIYFQLSLLSRLLRVL